MPDPSAATLAVASLVPSSSVTSASAAPLLQIVGGSPTQSVTQSSNAAVFSISGVPPEPEVGGDTVHGGSVGMSLSLSLSL